MGRNDRVIIALLAVVLCSLLWIGWQVQSFTDTPSVEPMTRTSEWVRADGTIERFTSARERGQSFDLFSKIHEQAVRELKE